MLEPLMNIRFDLIFQERQERRFRVAAQDVPVC